MATEFSDLPEGCVAHIISLTDPTRHDACRFALVSTIFHSAADSDVIWKRLVPPGLPDIIARADANTKNQLGILSKKQLLQRLTDSPILIDAGRKSFYLDKATGKKSVLIAARDLTISWEDDQLFWKWISHPESRFAQVACLSIVCWLEISLSVEASVLSPNTMYTAYLVMKLTERAYGFKYNRMKTTVGMSNGVKNRKFIYLALDDRRNAAAALSSNFNYTLARYPKGRVDGWMEVELGEVFVVRGDEMVEVNLTEQNGGFDFKHGLVVEGIEFRPKAVSPSKGKRRRAAGTESTVLHTI